MHDTEDILRFVDRALYEQTGEHLSNLQTVLIREVWQETRRTYEEIGEAYGYSSSYIQQGIAPKLWRLLSQVFNEKVNKKNLRAVLLGQLQQQATPVATALIPNVDTL